ncbi:MAG: Rrf2 family transcriptional regulator [Planctomycetaceae bacterium]|nr:Rrf2 family transcriptional regulator [Planctomycetaceae bacterium]
MISQTVEYALRAIVTIAQHEGVPCTAQKISAITQVPAPYLSKMMQGLVRASLVTSKRGLHGGFVLMKEPTELTILEVVDAVEPFKRIRECPLNIDTHSGTLCPLHRRLDNAMEMVENSFRDTTVADLLAQPGSVTPLCEENKVMTGELGNVAKKSQKKPATNRKKKKKNKG